MSSPPTTLKGSRFDSEKSQTSAKLPDTGVTLKTYIPPIDMFIIHVGTDLFSLFHQFYCDVDDQEAQITPTDSPSYSIGTELPYSTVVFFPKRSDSAFPSLIKPQSYKFSNNNLP